MSVDLDTLETRLQGDVPARDGVPSTAQYTQAVKDAVADYSQRVPMTKMVTLNIVAGTAAYSLPSDFLFVTKVASLANPTGVVLANAGIIPLQANWQEKWYVTGRTLTFYPTPAYSLSRDVWYAAGHVLDGDDAYPDMLEEDARIVMLKAQALALTAKANKAADDAWRYAIGPESVSKEVLVRELRAQAEALETQYLAAVERRIGKVGLQADYDVTGH